MPTEKKCSQSKGFGAALFRLRPFAAEELLVVLLQDLPGGRDDAVHQLLCLGDHDLTSGPNIYIYI